MGALTIYLSFFALLAFSTADFGGIFELSDEVGSCNECNDPSAVTLACACPRGAAPASYVRVVNDCSGSALHGGTIAVCNAAPSDGFGGVYQQDDPVPGGEGCRAANPQTGACSCPAGFASVATRVLADVSQGRLVGSHIVWCVGSPSRTFGGVYQVRDDAQCAMPNPATAACSCPAGLSPSVVRAIIDGPFGSHIAACVLGSSLPPAVELCPGVVVDATGASDAAAGVQTCIDRTPPGGTLLFPQGIYGLARQIVVSRSRITLRSVAMDPRDPRQCSIDPTIPVGACATLRALPGCCQSGGMLFIPDGTVGLVVDHMILDGNRDARVNTPQAAACVSGDRSVAYNAHSTNCNGCAFRRFASVRALCGTGFEYTGDNCEFEGCAFVANGNHNDKRWSDGLTLLGCRGGRVSNCYFRDNSDVNLILGCGTGATVTNITVAMTTGHACFAGFMMDNFNGGTCGDYTGAVVSRLAIDCGAQLCDFGLSLGPHAWYPSANIVGGTVQGAVVRGSKQGVVVAGAGTAAHPLVLVDLDIGPVPATADFLCGSHATSQLNIAPGSVVDRHGQTTPPATAMDWQNCP